MDDTLITYRYYHFGAYLATISLIINKFLHWTKLLFHLSVPLQPYHLLHIAVQ